VHLVQRQFRSIQIPQERTAALRPQIERQKPIAHADPPKAQILLAPRLAAQLPAHLNGTVACHSIAVVPRTRIKFCGITRPADAVAAAAAGADAIGLNFCASSPRRITIEQATQILATLPPLITPIGLFADSYAAEITRIVQVLHLTHIQLHGNETPSFSLNCRT
jgi:hypothetical protein